MRVALAAAAMLAASLAFRAAFPIAAAGHAGHDDALFVRLAAHIAAGDWLGPYDNLTHAKGAAYPAFIALVSFTGIPLKLAEHAVYLSGAGAFAWVVARLLRSRAAGLACLAFLAFNPVAWSADSGGRVVREGLYAALSLWILALAAHLFLSPEDSAARTCRRWVAAAALGIVGGLFWLTREEGLWLAPSVGLLMAAWAVRSWRTARPRFSLVAVPMAAFAAIVLAVNVVNYQRYGVFRNNDFRSRDFQQAYGALSRILHESPRPYVLFPADARAKAYAASPAARELAPALEGTTGEFWRAAGCKQTGIDPCPEILAGWFMWALRDAVAGAGHYESATRARSFYRDLTREVNAACDRGEIKCGPRRDSLVPPWREEYGPRVLQETLETLRALATLGDMNVAMKPSLGDAEELALFARMTHDRQAGEADSMKIQPGLMSMAQVLARAQVAAMPWLLTTAFAGTIALALQATLRRRWAAGLVLLAALWAAVAMRVGLLGFLAATSIPANNVLYLTPVFPMALVLAPLVLFLAFERGEGAPPR